MSETSGTAEMAWSAGTDRAWRPLTPLSPAESRSGGGDHQGRQAARGGASLRAVWLHEPDKHKARNWEPGKALESRVFAVAYDRSKGKTYEMVVSFTTRSLLAGEESPASSPPHYRGEYTPELMLEAGDGI